jgi:multimeric flavodoxin WrbA
MRVLGIAGSPRKNGNTDTLLAEVMRGAASKGAETKTIYLRDLQISTCLHCDACLKAGICRIKDDMQSVYTDLQQADVIVLASPVQFTNVTAHMKAMIDRCQSLWARKYRLKLPPLGDRRERKGFFISVGGRKVPNLFDPMLVMIKAFFVIIDVKYAGDLLFTGVDEKGAILNHPTAMKDAFAAGERLAGDPTAAG